jgi:hypothetical protein
MGISGKGCAQEIYLNLVVAQTPKWLGASANACVLHRLANPQRLIFS